MTAWWTRRERIAAKWGPRCWPLFYVAPRSTRARWEKVAAIIEANEDADVQAVLVSQVLEDVDLIAKGTTRRLAHQLFAPDEW
jgi:hypothetical protein